MRAGKIPTPQEHLIFVEQASCLFLMQDAQPLLPTKKIFSVKQASCPFLRIV